MMQPVGPGEQVAVLAAGTARDELQVEHVVLRIQANQGRLTARPLDRFTAIHLPEDHPQK